MSRAWTCRGCGTKHETRRKQKCVNCGKARPAPKNPTHRPKLNPCRGCGGPKDIRRAGAHFCSKCENDPLSRPLLISGVCVNGHDLQEAGVYLDKTGHNGRRPRWHCKACAAVDARANWADEEAQERNRWAGWRSTLKRKYGITEEDWFAIYEAQDGRCAICLRPLAAGPGQTTGSQPAVDHDHESGVVRGILCRMPCNFGLGVFKDDPWRLRQGARYLERPTTAVMASRGERSAVDELKDAA